MKTRRLIVASVVVACCMAWVSAYGEDETELKGLITGRTSDNMTVRAADGTTTNVVLTDDTKVQRPKGLGIRKQQMSWTDLIPGLRVEVKGTANPQGQLVAKQVQFSKDDLKTANMIQAGLTPTQAQVGKTSKPLRKTSKALRQTRKPLRQTSNRSTPTSRQ